MLASGSTFLLGNLDESFGAGFVSMFSPKVALRHEPAEQLENIYLDIEKPATRCPSPKQSAFSARPSPCLDAFRAVWP